MKKRAGLFLFLLAAIVAASGEPVDQQETAPVSGVTRIEVADRSDERGLLTLSTVRRNIIVAPESRGDVLIHLHGDLQTNRRECIPTFSSESAGGILRIVMETCARPQILLRMQGELTLDVRIPESYDRQLSVETSSAGITAGELELQELSLASSSGDIRGAIQNARQLEIVSSSGTISLAGFRGDSLRLQASSGDIEGGELSFEQGEIAASSGDIRIGTAAGELSVETSSGSITIETLDGGASLRSSSGRIQVLEAAGEILARATSGDIELGYNGNPGTVDAEASSGSITITELEGSGTVRTSSGTVFLGLVDITGDTRIEASSGDVTVELPGDAGLAVVVDTSSGRLRTEGLPITTMGELGSDRMRGTLGVGGPNLLIRSSSGDVTLTAR